MGLVDEGARMTDIADNSTNRWKKHLDRHADKRVRTSAANLLLILVNDDKLAGRILYNLFADEVVQRGELPWGDFGDAGAPLQDHHAFELAAYLAGPSYKMNASTRQVHEAVEAAARLWGFHPVRDWLDGLCWDGKRRLHQLFGSMIGGADTPYTETVSLNVLVSAIERAMNPGAKVDNMVVLEGPQGFAKSSMFAALFAPWCSEAMESPAHKDFYQSLRGKWAVEIAEMDAFSRAEVTQVKRAITTTTDRYRPSYGRVARDFARQCIFFGTTNEDRYLRDATGARRFWPVKCTAKINVDEIGAQREQLFAEARHLHAKGWQFWQLPPGAEVEQEDRYLQDSWEPVVARWLDHPPRNTSVANENIEGHASHTPEPALDVQRDAGGRVVAVAIAEALRFGLGLDYSRQTRPDQMRVAGILRRLGWDKRRASAAGAGRTYLWERPA